MDFTPTEEQRELAALTRTILAGGRDPWKELATAGILSAALPADVGGAGLGLLDQCGVLIELGRAAVAEPYLESVVLAASAVAAFGSPQQQATWAVPAARGDLVLTAAPDAAVYAAMEGERWVLSGSASAVPHGTAADMVLVPTPAGVFAVELGDPGVVVESQNVGGFACAALTFDDVRLGPDRLLSAPALGGWLRDRALVGLCALQLGVLERALELTAAYAAERVQFGRPLGAFQAVRQRLADAYVDVEAVRLTLWQAAWRLAEGLPCGPEIATAKFWAADAGHRVAHTAVHLHGGVGIDVSHPVHRYFLAAKYYEFALGGATAQLLTLGSLV